MKRLIDWFIDNRVAANLLMTFIVAGGALTLVGLKQEVFPDVSPQMVTASVAWPGATPEEVEEGVCIKIEEAVEGLEGIKRISSESSENAGVVRIEAYQDTDMAALLDDVKTRVDTISTFPDAAEKPVIAEVEAMKMVVSVVVSGKTDALALKRTAQSVRDELAALPGISRVSIANAPDYEVSIEVSEDALRHYGLGFDDVTRAVRANSLKLHGGTVRARGGDILLRSDTQAYVREDFEKLLLVQAADGTRIELGDVARVVDGFEDVEQWSLFDGEPALVVNVFRVGDQSAPVVAAEVDRYLATKRASLPAGVHLSKWKSWAKLLDQRRSLLLKNGKWGLALIFGILLLFLRARLAFWVALGLPVCFLGALWLLPAFDTTINMMSLFAFILVLGILVDDAIVVSENIHWHTRNGKRGPDAAKAGTWEVLLPVTLAVLTTIAAFVPMTMLPGTMGQFARVIPIVVVCALSFSLIESLLILPHHLHGLRPRPAPQGVARMVRFFTDFFSRGLEHFVDWIYRPLLGLALRWRYVTLATGAGIIVLAAAMFRGGLVRFSFFPPIPGDQLVASLKMPEGTPTRVTEASLKRITGGLERLRKAYEAEGHTVIKHMLTSVGTQPQQAEVNWDRGKGAPQGSHLGEVFVELYAPDERGGIEAEEIMRRLRAEVGEIPGVQELKYEVAIHSTGAPVSVQLRGRDHDTLRRAADRVKERLARFDGTFDISDDLVAGKQEFRLFIKPEAQALGLTQAELARQVRQGFYGDEAQRIQRGRDDVKVMVRYPRERRRSLADLDDMRIRTPGGGEVPFRTVARAEPARGPASIHRADGSRTVTVNADVDLAVANANQIVDALERDFLPDLAREFAGLTWSFEGQQREQSETLGGLMRGSVLAALLIFSLLALAFNSWSQPVLVLTAIPFGMVGAVLGHWWMGLDLTLLSAIGLLAMAGVVVNDSMILVDFVNRARAGGTSAYEAVKQAGPRRFRAVILTSLTTFAGLTPLLMETSVQAQFLIPMAISLSFGVAFSTLVTLLFVPATYLILEDVFGFARGAVRLLGLRRPEAAQARA